MKVLISVSRKKKKIRLIVNSGIELRYKLYENRRKQKVQETLSYTTFLPRFLLQSSSNTEYYKVDVNKYY